LSAICGKCSRISEFLKKIYLPKHFSKIFKIKKEPLRPFGHSGFWFETS
jgi:predicted nucleic-acid-binding Zn-ribbon protein